MLASATPSDSRRNPRSGGPSRPDEQFDPYQLSTFLRSSVPPVYQSGTVIRKKWMGRGDL
jgi:hypothetical protein